MEQNPWVSAFLTFIISVLCVSGEKMRPENVSVHIWEGNITLTWDPPVKNPVGHTYLVQLYDYESGESAVWNNVSNCNLIKATVCNIGYLQNMNYAKVRVGMFTRQGPIWSRSKSINLRESQLYPPSFNMSSTPYSIQVKVHRKPKLKELFPYDVLYTVYLFPEGQENQTLTKNSDDNDYEITFDSLKPWQVYCIRLKVENKATDARNVSTDHCVRLPLDIAVVIYFVFMGVLGLLVLLVFFVCCFLRRPRKMPAALKPVVNGWRPMSIGCDQVETITDMGWIIIGNETNRQALDKFIEEDIERRESLDSGVSMEQLLLSDSKRKTDEHLGDVQEDSGCGSLKEADGSGSVRTAAGDLIAPDEISHDDSSEEREDSGLGLSHHEVSGSLEGADSGLLSAVVVGDGYRSQSPSSVDVQSDVPAMPCDMDSIRATPSGGYRSGQVTCLCLDHEYCVWCKSKKPLTAESESPQVPTHLSQLVHQSNDGNSTISSYLKKSLMQTVNLLGMEDSQSDTNYDESSQFLMSCPLLLQSQEDEACITNTLSFTLDDVELTFS